MTAPGSVRKIFKTALQQVYNLKVDDRRQEYQDLHNSSVAVMLREMQREVNMGRPLESRLHIDYNTSNHF